MLSRWPDRVNLSSVVLLLLGISVVFSSRLNAAQSASALQDALKAAFSSGRVNGSSNTRPPQQPLPQYRCFEGEYGSVFTGDTAWARKALAAFSETVPRFEKLFGKRVRRPLVIYNVPKEAAETASCSGNRELSWNPMWDSTTLQKNMVKTPEQWKSEMKSHRPLLPGLSERQLRDSLDLQYADYVGTFGDNVYVMTHEVGHFWFMQHYTMLFMSYGTGGPGWLMETAAMMMEDPRLDRQRRRELIRNYRADKAGKEPKRIRPLDTLLTMPHKGQNAYYAQVRGVMDFLLERTKDSTIFGAMAEINPWRADFSAWLRANGARYGLPTTMEQFEKEWLDWVARLAATGLGYDS